MPAEFEEKLVGFQHHVIGLQKTKESIMLIQTGNADEKPLYFIELSNYTGNDVREKPVMMKTSADSNKLPPFVILDHKTKPKEQMPRKITSRCQSKCWMANELLQD